MFNSYKEAVAYLESFIAPTQFARIERNKHLTDPLDRMRYLLNLLGNPHDSYPAIQVSGTSGKGSTAYLISHILKVSGKKVGFTLSPHLEKINERIQINNVPISDDEFVQLLSSIQPALRQMETEWIGKPSYFEVLLAMTLLYFKKQEIDILVAEVGLEGKYDGTNVLHPLAAVLTNISLDHTKILGDTVEKIAEEATSIIKEPEMIVVTGVEQESVKQTVSQRADDVSAYVVWCDKSQILSAKTTTDGSRLTLRLSSGQVLTDLQLSLIGSYQHLNTVLAVEAVLAIKAKGFLVSEPDIRKAVSTALFPGRFEVIHTDPVVILDGAHNAAKMEAFITDLKTLYPDQKKIFCIAFKEGKDIEAMIKTIEQIASEVIVTKFSVSTDLKNYAAPTSEIKKVLLDTLRVQTVEKAKTAVKHAQKLAKENRGIVVVTGSLYLVGEIRSLLRD